MSTINVANAPFINHTFVVSGAFGEPRGSGVHRGLDLAPTGYAGTLYAIDDFTIQYTGFDGSGYGNYFIANNGNGMMYLYAHMSTLPPAVGTHIPIHGYIGEAGSTGSSTGVHLHLEMQQGTTWQYNAPLSTYINPCDYLTGILNQVDYNTYYIYEGVVPPTPPPTQTEEHKFPWFIFDADPDIIG